VGVCLRGSVRQIPEEDFRLIESEMKKVVPKHVKREEAQPESAKPSEKSERRHMINATVSQQD